MNLVVGVEGEKGIARLIGNVGFDHRAAVFRAFRSWLEDSPVTRVVVDCSGVTGLDSAGLALLLLMRDHTHAQRRHFSVRRCGKGGLRLLGDPRFLQLFCVDS